MFGVYICSNIEKRCQLLVPGGCTTSSLDGFIVDCTNTPEYLECKSLEKLPGITSTNIFCPSVGLPPIKLNKNASRDESHGTKPIRDGTSSSSTLSSRR